VNYKTNKTIVDYISSALCAPITPSRPIPFAANAAATEWSLLLHDVIGDWMILFAANELQCIVNGEENPQNCPFPWDFVTLPEEDRARAIGNMHRRLSKDHACGSGDILADRQIRNTDRQTCWSQYFAITPAVMSHTCLYSQPQNFTARWPAGYLFPIPLRVGGWIGLDGWLHTETVSGAQPRGYKGIYNLKLSNCC